MKTLIFIMILSSTSVFAQDSFYAVTAPTRLVNNSSINSFNNSFKLYRQEPGKRKIEIGRGLTIGGGVLLIAGIAMVSTADEYYYNYSSSTNGGTTEEGDAKGAFGLLMTIGGTGMIIPGIIIWSKGAKQNKAYKEKQNLSLGANRNGIGLRYSF